MNIPKLPSPNEIKKSAEKTIDDERGLLQRRMLQWDGNAKGRISLFDLTHKAALISELEAVGWRAVNEMSVEPANLEARFEAPLASPAELWEALEKEHASTIQAELRRLQEDVLPKIQASPQQRGRYKYAGQHPFVTHYLAQSLLQSGWWVDSTPLSVTAEREMVITPRQDNANPSPTVDPTPQSTAEDKPKRKSFFGI